MKISGIVADMDPEVATSDYGKIEELIAIEDSHVGIDAKKTHVIISQKLLRIEERLVRLKHLVTGEDT